jgi:NADPH2:quinone reductase
MEWVADGRIRPHVGLVLPLERIGEAMAAIAGRTSSGRVVMKVK